MANNNVTLSINGKDKATPVIAQVKASTVALGVAVGNLATKGSYFLINQTLVVSSMRPWMPNARI